MHYCDIATKCLHSQRIALWVYRNYRPPYNRLRYIVDGQAVGHIVTRSKKVYGQPWKILVEFDSKELLQDIKELALQELLMLKDLDYVKRIAYSPRMQNDKS